MCIRCGRTAVAHNLWIMIYHGGEKLGEGFVPAGTYAEREKNRQNGFAEFGQSVF